MEDESQACLALDQSWAKMARSIQQRVGMLDRVLRVRVSSWLAKLHADGCATSNATWLRNRNAYARLLLEQLRAGCLEVPFNSMPPDGVLPMLPTYLKYRYLQPSTKAQQQQQQAGCERTAAAVAAAAAGSAGSSGVQRMPSKGSHSSWRVAQSPAPVPQAGSRPAHGASPTGPVARRAGSSSPAPRTPLRVHLRANSSPHAGGSSGRPRSPGAAGLLDAAAALAAELDAERDDAEQLSSRLQFAEAKLLSQEAELTRLQGQAAATRRRLKCATAGTLQELQERVGSGGARRRSPAAGSPDVAEAMHGLLSGLQDVLDNCDREEREWQRAQGAAAAAAIERRYEEQQEGAWAAAGEGAGQQHTPAQRVASQAAAAAASEAAVLRRVHGRLSGLAGAAGELGAALLAKKEEATAAAGGQGGQRAADVAAAAAGLLKSMLGHLKAAPKDTEKLRARLAEAAQAAQAANDAAQELAVTTRERQSDADDASSTCSSVDAEEEEGGGFLRRPGTAGSQQRLERERHHQQALAQACEQRGQQDARVLRLQAAGRLLDELDKAAGRLAGQLTDAQQKLLAALSSGGSNGSSAYAAAAGQQHHDNGLLAAATAGITASTAAGVRSLHACLTNLQTELQALRQGSTPSRALAAASAASSLLRQHSSPVGAAPGAASPAAAFLPASPVPLVASEAAAEAVHARLASLSRQASRMSARTSLLLAATPLSTSSTPTPAAASPASSPRPGSLLLGGGSSGVGSPIGGGGSLASLRAAPLLSAPLLGAGVVGSPPGGTPTSRLLLAASLGGSGMSSLAGPASQLLAVGSGSGRLLSGGLGMSNTGSLLTSTAPGSPLLAKGGLLAQSLFLSSPGGGGGSIGSSSSRIAAISSHLANLGRPA